MGRYRKVEVSMWADDKFVSLSKPQPNAQSLWMYLLTGPCTTSLPGLIRIGEAGLAEEIGWPLKAFREAFGEVLSKGMAKADWGAYLNRAMLQVKAKDNDKKLHRLLKHGLSANHWNEFVFQAYHHHQHDAIFLAGIPDVKGSLPHA